MKISHLNTFDIEGGAARAAYRIHKGLCADNIDSNFLVRNKYSTDDTVIQTDNTKLSKIFSYYRQKIETLEIKRYNTLENCMWSPASISNSGFVSKLNISDYDIINLHWINLGFLSINDISRIKKPIIWTIHDMWPFTGGCHYSGECNKYQTGCNKCYQLNSNDINDISNKKQSKKIITFKKIKRVVAPSVWIGKCAKESMIFKDVEVNVIPYGLDTNLFQPSDKTNARRKFNLSEDKTLILFPGFPDINNQRKGFSYLIKALKELSEENVINDNVELVVLGKSNSSYISDLQIKVNHIDRLNDDVLLASLYSACDFSICTSKEDNLPNTVLESLSSGTPVIGFNIGGIPDMIEDGLNGLIAKPFEILSLANCIKTLILSPNLVNSLSINSRNTALQKFSMSISTNRYINLYQEIMIACQ